MSEQLENASTRGRARDWLRKHQWGIVGFGIVLGILAVCAVGHFASDGFVRDFAANLAADAVVAVVAFAVVDMALGLRQRRERETEAREKALTILVVELMENETLLGYMLRALKGEVTMPVPWPVIRSDTWELFVQSPLVAHLHVDLLWNLHISYALGLRAVESAQMWQRDPAWKPSGDVPAELVSEIERAQQRTVDTIFMLAGVNHDTQIQR